MDIYDDFHPNNLEVEITKEIKTLDPGYTRVKRGFESKRGRVIKKWIDVYVSGSIGSKIRDAKTGHYFEETVGSKEELNFFKVALSTGELLPKNGLNTLFYISPAEYELHMSHSLDPQIHEKWKAKQVSQIGLIQQSSLL